VKRLLGILGWIGVALVVAAVVMRFSRPDLAQWSQRTALAGLIVTVLYSLSQWRDIARSFGGRNVKYGSLAATSVLLVLGILVATNWISSRQNKRWDLTAGGQFSLSDQTRQILTSLTKPVNIKVFYVGQSEEYRDRLQEYAYTSSQVKVEYVDADRNPVEAQRLGIQTVPTFVLEYDGRSERATGSDEQTLTNALKKVIEGRTKKIYFIQGHGEHDPTVSTATGYSGVSDALKNDNFEVANLTLAQAGTVPDDASVVVIAGPKMDVLPAEVDALRAYLGRGGKLHLLLDPPDKGTGPAATNLIALAREWGIGVGDNLVVDASGLGQMLGTDASVPIAMPVQHPITDKFNLMTAFPIARSVAPIEGGTDGRTAQKFLETSAQSWAETDIAGLFATGRPERNVDKGDQAGPVSIAAAVSAAAAEPPAPASGTPAPNADAPKPETRVVVVGDSDFASNAALGMQGNRDLYLNMANWLAQQEDMIAIRPRSAEDRPISMTADQGLMVRLFGLIVVPSLLMLAGVAVWWKKR
jgi:ABC-type uncharacterized transport system involved in gliding motility auxiliary subunit